MSHLWFDIHASTAAAASHPCLGDARIKMAFCKVTAIYQEPVYLQLASGREGVAAGGRRRQGVLGKLEFSFDVSVLSIDHWLIHCVPVPKGNPLRIPGGLWIFHAWL